MATKAELLAELDALRAKMAEIDEPETPAPQDPSPSDGASQETERAAAASELERLLTPHGVSVSEIEGLVQQLWKELDTLPHNKPIVTAIAAFALGFLAGRLTK
jgi:hypothetical protein